jgi:RNA polymerase sigma-70 factor (ECF subfamily)
MTASTYLVESREDALDVTQETFLRAWRSLEGFSGQSSFRTWLLVIATNTARSLAAHRRAKKRSSPVVSMESRSGEVIDIPEPDQRNSPENRALRGELKEAIEAAIANLDPEARGLVILRDLQGETYEAISTALSLPLGTVKSRIHRARLELRERLKEYI